MADLVVSLLAVLLIGFAFVAACAVLVWALPLHRFADWLDRHDHDITTVVVGALLLLALLVAGSSAI